MPSHAGKRSLTSTAQTASSGDVKPTIGKRTLVDELAGSVQRSGASDAGHTDHVHAAAARGVATPSTTLPHYSMIQRAFGRHDISAVQAHVGAEARASADAMGADAYATGNHVVLGKGTDLFTAAHEAAHIVQQRGGVQLKGGVGETGDAYERHADEVASLVVQGKSAEGLLDRYAADRAGPTASGPVQRMESQAVGPVQRAGSQAAAPSTSQAPAPGPSTADARANTLRVKINEQVARVKAKVVEELRHYEAVSRVIAQEARAGRLSLSPADLERFDRLNEDADNLLLVIYEPEREDDISEAHRSTEMLKGINQVKQSGDDVLDGHAGTVLPLVEEIDTLNYLVQNRLDRLALGYKAELDDANRFASLHDSGVSTPESLGADYKATVKTLRNQIEHARAETKVETSMLTLLGAALLAEVQNKAEGVGKRVHKFFSTKSATRHRTEKSAAKRQQEITDKFGDFYDVTTAEGEVDMKLRPQGVGSVTIPELEERMDTVLADGKPRYMARAVRAAVDRSPDFERTDDRGPDGKKREGVGMTPETCTRVIDPESAANPVAPRHRLLQAGLTADRDIKLNDLKFSLTRDAREAIDGEYEKSTSWFNPTQELTREKVALLTRTVDVIVLCKTADEMLQAIHEAQRQHDELWRERRQRNGGETAQTLERWAEAVVRFEA